MLPTCQIVALHVEEAYSETRYLSRVCPFDNYSRNGAADVKLTR